MKVVTFGELLLRLASPGYTRLFQKDNLDATFCGAEANVAVSLSVLGAKSVFVTRLPDSDVGRAAAHSLDYFKVDTSRIVFGEGRMGLFYLEKGASQRPSKVIYDREYSALARADLDTFDWDAIFHGADWFHWTGITPALSDVLPEILWTACQKAREKGVTVSCDLNYRQKLWSRERAKSVMSRLMPLVDVCIGNEEDAEKVLGISPEGSDVKAGRLDSAGYVRTAERIHGEYGCRYVAATLRKSYSASRNGWSAMLYDGKTRESYDSRVYDIQIVDRVGSGDSFGAGLIYALGSGMDPQSAVDFAAAASCLKHTVEGDYNRVTRQEVEDLLRSGGGGRIQR